MARRILVLNERDPLNPLAGGAETHLFEIFRRLVAKGHEVTMLTASFAGCKSEEGVVGVHVRRLANRYLYYARVSLETRREVRRGRYDLVVDVLNKVPFLSPWVVSVPCLAIVHHLFGTTAFRQVALPLALVTWLSEKLIPLAYARTPMLAISPSTKDDLAARGIAREHVWVVPPGIDHEAYRLLHPIAGREPRIVWVGRVEPYKRCDVMLEAMPAILERVPEARLVVVGDGSARDDLVERVNALGICHAVFFAGYLPEAEKIAELGRASLVVNTSEKEGWGMTVIEGNACGTPSVSTDVPGLRDSVRDGATGVLVPLGDARALAEAVSSLLADDDRRERMAAAGLEWARRFSWNNVADDTLMLIEEAIAPSHRPLALSASPLETA